MMCHKKCGRSADVRVQRDPAIAKTLPSGGTFWVQEFLCSFCFDNENKDWMTEIAWKVAT